MSFFVFYWILSRFQPFFNKFPWFLLDFEPFSAVFNDFFVFIEFKTFSAVFEYLSLVFIRF